MDAILEPMKARRLYLLLRDKITSGGLVSGARLPGEPSLAREHRVSRVTVRRALDQLQAEGLIQRQAGVGTFVKDRPIVQPMKASLVDVLSHLVEMGRSTGVRLVSFAYCEPPQDIRTALRLEENEQTQRSVRVRLVDGAPFSHLTTYVPKRIGVTYSESDLAAIPLVVLLERSGVVAEQAAQTVTATLAGPEVAQELEVEIGSPLISLTRVVFDQSGLGVEHLHGLYRPDRYQLYMDLVRSEDGGQRVWTVRAMHQGAKMAQPDKQKKQKRTKTPHARKPKSSPRKP